jgi:CRISPR-associated protein Cas1
MRLLNTVYVTDHRYRVTAAKESLEIRLGTELVARFPMNGTDSVILAGQAGITTEAIGRCVRRGITVASLHGSGRLRFVVHGETGGNVLLRLRQYEVASDPVLTLQLARRFVAGKLQNQLRLMRRWQDGAAREMVRRQAEVVHDRLRSVPTARDGDTVRGLEGDATRRYFKALGAHLAETAPSFVFLGRSRRPPTDPINAVLSYVYSLLTIDSTGAAEAAGLDPQLGFLHRPRPGRPSLALDLIEEFRAAFAERFTARLLGRRELGPESFTRVGDAHYLSDEGRRALLARWEAFRSEEVRHPLLERSVSRALVPKIQATLLARHLRGDLPDYAPYVSEW